MVRALATGLLLALLAGCGGSAEPRGYALAAGETLRYTITLDERYRQEQRLPLAVTDPNRIDPTILTEVRAQLFITCTGTDSTGAALVQCGYDSFILTATSGNDSTSIGFAGDTIYFYNRAGFALAVPAALAGLPLPTARAPWPARLEAQRGLRFTAAHDNDTFATLLACWHELFPPLADAARNWTESGPLPAPAPADRALAYQRRFSGAGREIWRGVPCERVTEESDNDLAGMRFALAGDTYGLIPAGTEAVYRVWHEQRRGEWQLRRIAENRSGNPAGGEVTVTHEESVESVLPDPLAAAGTERYARTVTMTRHFVWRAADLPADE